MSIVTKAGDQGITSLMYGRRVPKNDPKVEAYGAADELNAALGLARATAREETVSRQLLAIQKDLVVLMGELATAAGDLPRYLKDGFSVVVPSMTAGLETAVKQLEQQDLKVHGWATPGVNLHSAALDMARTICRRTERRVCSLQPAEAHNPEIIVYLNRLSDLLWLLARRAEAGSA